MKTNHIVSAGLVLLALVVLYRERRAAQDLAVLRIQIEALQAEYAKLAQTSAAGESGSQLCAKIGIGRWDEKSRRCLASPEDHDRLERLESSVYAISARYSGSATPSPGRAPSRAAARDDRRVARPSGPNAARFESNRLYYVSELLPKNQVGWGAQIVGKGGFKECYNPQGQGYCKVATGRQTEFACRAGTLQEFARTESKHGYPTYMKACLP